MTPKNRMREIRSYGSVGVSAGNRRHYPETSKWEILTVWRRLLQTPRLSWI